MEPENITFWSLVTGTQNTTGSVETPGRRW